MTFSSEFDHDIKIFKVFNIFSFSAFLAYVNSASVKAATKLQVAFTIAKVLALTVIIIAGLYSLATGHTPNYQNTFKGSNWQMTAIATSYYQGFVSFAGW